MAYSIQKKILLLELSATDSCARSPSRYSGCGPTLRRLAENIPNVYLAAETSCFEGDTTEKCIAFDKIILEGIRKGYPLNYSYNYNGVSDFDVYIYSDPSFSLNTLKPQICWALGHQERVCPTIKNLLLHNAKWQKPEITNPNTKVFEFVLGINIPVFQENLKREFCFQCSNHYSQIQSARVAEICNRNNIPLILAGPSSGEYRKLLLKHIDYKNTFYLGEIDEEEKIKLMKEARCYTNLVTHHINGPQLSVKMAWSYGTPVIATPLGIMPEVIQEGVNGFLVKNEQEFVTAYYKSFNINQKDCFDTSTNWSIDKMVKSFNDVLGVIL